jgi:hypothetical protein
MITRWQKIDRIPDRELEWHYMTPDMGQHEIEPNVVYWDWVDEEHVYQGDEIVYQGDEGKFPVHRETRKRKQIKFLLLPGVIPHAINHRLEMALVHADWTQCNRAANGQKNGQKLTVGWFPQREAYATKSLYTNIRAAQTLEQPHIMSALRPLLHFMDDKIKEELPEYHDFAFKRALNIPQPYNQVDDISRVEGVPKTLQDFGELPDPKAIVANLDPWNSWYTLWNTIFSTVEINRNIVFKAHEDKSNVEGTLVGLCALGSSFVGGRLVFPRYGYSAELSPRDLLICDNNRELHGNLGPIVGVRYSVVAYLYWPLQDIGVAHQYFSRLLKVADFAEQEVIIAEARQDPYFVSEVPLNDEMNRTCFTFEDDSDFKWEC